MSSRNVPKVHTDSAGWQEKCWQLARARADFEILDFSEKNLLFIQELGLLLSPMFRE